MEAYDGPRWSLIAQKLQRHGLAPMLIEIPTNPMFREMYSILIVNGVQLKRIRLDRGLFQGSLLSPMLFNVFLNDLLQSIHEEFFTVEKTRPAVMYADDLFLLWRIEAEAMSAEAEP